MPQNVAYTVAIGLSATTVEVATASDDGQCLTAASAPIAARPCPPPSVRQRPSDWIAALDKAFAGTAAQCTLAGVIAVTIGPATDALLAGRADGTPIGDALMPEDASGAGYADSIAANAPPTFAPTGAKSPLARALWIHAARHPERLFHQADWLAGGLSSRFETTGESVAADLGYDPRAHRWPEWVGRLSPALPLLFGKVEPPGSITGRLEGDLARTLGLPESAAFVTGSVHATAADAAIWLARTVKPA